MSPLVQYIREALQITNASFAPAGDAPALQYECYAQLRRLWDRGIPVGLGVGHVVIHPVGELLKFTRIADDGTTAGVLGAVAFTVGTDIDVTIDTLVGIKAEERILVVFAAKADMVDGVTVLTFDPVKRTVS